MKADSFVGVARSDFPATLSSAAERLHRLTRS
jgi:hypothetical protein